MDIWLFLSVRCHLIVRDFAACICHAEVEDVASCRSFADGGALLTLAMFYLEGECHISVKGIELLICT